LRVVALIFAMAVSGGVGVAIGHDGRAGPSGSFIAGATGPIGWFALWLDKRLHPPTRM
jgi:hypothetical protein